VKENIFSCLEGGAMKHYVHAAWGTFSQSGELTIDKNQKAF
jgi:hypothetical protein